MAGASTVTSRDNNVHLSDERARVQYPPVPFSLRFPSSLRPLPAISNHYKYPWHSVKAEKTRFQQSEDDAHKDGRKKELKWLTFYEFSICFHLIVKLF